MKVKEMTDELFINCMKEILYRINMLEIRLSSIDVNCKINPTPTSYMGDEIVFPFPLALELKRIWDYARGTAPYPDEYHEIKQDLIELLFVPLWSTSSYEVPQSFWTDTLLGQMFQIAEIRMKVDKKEMLNSEELSLVSNVTPQYIRKLLQDGKIKAIKDDPGNKKKINWQIPYEEYIRYVAKFA